MKKIYILMIALLLLNVYACDDSNDEKTYKGKISVTVNTSDELWGFPQIGKTLSTSWDKDGTWMYPEVGGTYWYTEAAGYTGTCGVDDPDVEDLADEAIGTGDIGDRINVVYLYGTLDEASKDTPVLYRGSSSTNNAVITIKNIAPGDYYVVAFYDYNSGGNRENLLNRYDRYSFYDLETIGSDNGTPFVNLADTITVNEDTHEITLDIHQDWALGRPKYILDSGRVFMNSDPEYTGVGNTTIPTREVTCP
ncbi:MAG TPA: hypothetical protein PK926_13470 [Spirochaetota bacterium]|nr:hypothetical protein [Spirochaetota bacterium]HPI89459.1 hypothetical protein [Spirochaetota bacterium]HPR49316.1 hypothetical protein [Spirochaetota bacterium]